MRLFLNILISLFLFIGLLISFNYSINNISFQASNNYQINDRHLKIITVTIKIKDNLPIRKDIVLKTKHYFRLQNNKLSLISLINKLNLNTEEFNILEQDLSLEIDANYTLVICPKRLALQLYNRHNITTEVLLNIGLKSDDVKKIINIFHDLQINSSELETKLKTVLPTAKRKFLKIIREFVIF